MEVGNVIRTFVLSSADEKDLEKDSQSQVTKDDEDYKINKEC